MQKSKSTVEINGKHYDAHTGQLVGTAIDHAPPPSPNVIKTVDGMRAPAHHSHHRAHVSSSDVHNTAHKSSTLRRQTVRKPAHAAHTTTHKKASGIHHVTPLISHMPLSVSGGSVDSKPHTTADTSSHTRNIKRSSLVSRFGKSSYENSVVKKVEHMQVKAAPPHEAIERPHHEAPLPERDAPEAFTSTTREVSHLERSIERSNSHKAAPHRKVSRRQRMAHRMSIHPSLINIGAASVIALLLISFLVYQNTDKLSMKVASARSGLSAAVPATLPTGYAMNSPIRYAPGLVSMQYGTAGSNNSFTLSEQHSEWTSSTLFSNMFADGTVSYQTHQRNGLTIYTYGQGNATWVSSGVRYDITGDSGLTNEQIIKIATSL